jgi:hypothetical protein
MAPIIAQMVFVIAKPNVMLIRRWPDVPNINV